MDDDAPPTLQDLEKLARQAGLPRGLVRSHARRATRLELCNSKGAIGATRLGGLPDLPASVAWPRWDTAAYDAAELERYSRQASAFARRRIEELRARRGGTTRPLSFVAQLNLSDLVGTGHGLPLPAVGHLYFFYELSEQPWGYDPAHAGAFRVLYAGPGEALERRNPPDDLAADLLLAHEREASMRDVWTIPSSPDVELSDEVWDAYDDFKFTIGGEAPAHQLGGHPLQIQGDMQRICALVTKGISLGEPPDMPRRQLDALASDAGDWRLLLQLDSDDALHWMWGDLGAIYFWMREADIAAGNWDRAWFQFQCS